MVQPSLVGVAAAAVVAAVVGALWYNPIMFGRVWLANVFGPGYTMPDTVPKTPFVVSFLGNLLTAYVFGHFLIYMKAESLNQIVTVAWWTAVLIAAIETQHYAFAGRKPWAFVIEQLHNLVMLIAQGLVLAFFQK